MTDIRDSKLYRIRIYWCDITLAPAAEFIVMWRHYQNRIADLRLNDETSNIDRIHEMQALRGYLVEDHSTDWLEIRCLYALVEYPAWLLLHIEGLDYLDGADPVFETESKMLNTA
jgi:hypothetical protein